MTGAPRDAIRGMDEGLSVVELASLKFMEALTQGAGEWRCRAVWVFGRLQLDCTYKAPPLAEIVRVEIDAAPLDEVERDCH